MNKIDAFNAINRLEGQAVVNWEATTAEKDLAKRDARRLRRFMNAERQEILILRRYVHMAARVIRDYNDGIRLKDSDSVIAEMREAAKPKRKART
jgi:hypothetical protein